MKAFPLNGILVVDKPQGWTSHDCIGKLRGITKQKRIGHIGTLDPLATGVLVLLLGSATRLSDALMSDDKVYEVRIKLGESTDTDDSEGETLQALEVPSEYLSVDYARQTLETFVGAQLQKPPLYSSLKVEGKIAHREARRGRDIEPALRPIEIYSISHITTDSDTQTWSFKVHSSKGTYIRALARDIGEKLKVGAHVVELRRVQSGAFSIDAAQSIAELEGLSLAELSSKLYPIDTLFDADIVIDDYHARTGRGLNFKSDKDSITAYSADGRLLGLYEKKDGQHFAAKTIFTHGIQGPRIGACFAAIGNFDGVHTGHAALISKLVEEARLHHMKSVVMTFDPLPQKVLNRAEAPHQLLGIAERVDQIRALGVDEVVIIPFSEELASLSPRAFVERVMLCRAEVRKALVGSNFRFGSGASAGPFELAEILSSYESDVEVVDLAQDEEGTISSTRIRIALQEGDIAKATALLGRRPLLVSDTIVSGLQMGRSLGFPTANMRISAGDNFKPGIYAATGRIEGQDYEVALFIGSPREEHAPKTFEAHILDFEGDLYGTSLTLEIWEFIDEVQRYSTTEELKTGIKGQIAKIKRYFSHI